MELINIFNQSYQTGHIPDTWKSGLVIPILKPGKDKVSPTSYRPITMLSCLGKTFERIIKRRLEYMTDECSLLSPAQ